MSPIASHVALVGLPGAGKTTVGQRVAALLGVRFVDLDAELVARAGASIAEQFARNGETAFRAAEAALSRELAVAEPSVLAPGGGWMTNAAARAALDATTRTIFLRVSPAIAADRLAHDPVVRPLVAASADPAEILATLLARRHAAYEAADATIGTDDRTADEVAAAVVSVVRSWPRAPSPSAGRLGAAA